MNIKIHAIHIDISEQLEAYANKKISKLEKLTDEIINVDVFFKVIKPETAANKEVDIKITMPNAEFFASKINNSFEGSLDTAIDAIEKQIIKFKKKARE